MMLPCAVRVVCCCVAVTALVWWQCWRRRVGQVPYLADVVCLCVFVHDELAHLHLARALRKFCGTPHLSANGSCSVHVTAAVCPHRLYVHTAVPVCAKDHTAVLIVLRNTTQDIGY